MASSRNRTPPERLPGEAAAAILEAAGIGPGSRLCVALSGGADSVVVLHVLAGLRGRFGFALAAAHVDHGLSPNAAAWRAFCERLCVSLGIPFQSFLVDVPRDRGVGLEAAARGVRHDALSKVDADWLVFGHHQDDLAETVLFRLVRGAGVRGAGAMAAIEVDRSASGGRLRPLLGVRRGAILAHAREHGLEWIEDESNFDRVFARNRLRHAVLPALEEAFPGAVPALARASGHFREADALLGELASIDSGRCGDPLRRAALLGLSDARIRNLMRWQMRCLGADAPSRARLIEAVRQIREGDGRPLRIALGKLAVCVYRDQVWLESDVQADSPPSSVRWRDGEALAWGSGRVSFDRVVGQGLDPALLERAREVTLTPRWDGLRLRPGPGRPQRSFKNLCQEAGIPQWLRSRLPVLQVDGSVAWIAEVGVDAAFACPEGVRGIVPVWVR
ncbi:MAG TPA: tRNA lysidine(34) synthetase TilS [Rhodocyclaceae bacterium]|nr:tRNA lysidine(34) synthetase TilS [Rhodocyclaceae bacterium]